MKERINIAIGYDESVDFDPQADPVDDENDVEISPESVMEIFGEFVAHAISHVESHHAAFLLIDHWPPTGGQLARAIFDLGLATYLGKPIVLAYRVGAIVPDHIRALATHVVSYDTDDPLASPTVQAMIERYK